MPDDRVSTELRQQVVERAYGCCEYCSSQARFATQSFSVEHIVPRDTEEHAPCKQRLQLPRKDMEPLIAAYTERMY